MHMNEDNLLIGQIEDKISQCDHKYMAACTGFLDSHQQSIARSIVRKPMPVGVKPVFYGGYDDADRVILACLPEYAEIGDDDPLTVIRASLEPGGRELTHRDYLGSLTGTGIKRDKIGDILVRPDGADIIVLAEIKDFLLYNYGKAGRTYLSLSEVPLSELIIPEQKKITRKDTVASLRADSIVASMFGLSRSKAAEAITRGIVFVNHMEVTKTDQILAEGDAVVLRGSGKAIITEASGVSRKGRIYVTFDKFV